MQNLFYVSRWWTVPNKYLLCSDYWNNAFMQNRMNALFQGSWDFIVKTEETSLEKDKKSLIQHILEQSRDLKEKPDPEHLKNFKKALLNDKAVQNEINQIEDLLKNNPSISDNAFVMGGTYLLHISKLNTIYAGMALDLGGRYDSQRSQFGGSSNTLLGQCFWTIKSMLSLETTMDYFKKNEIAFLPVYQFPCNIDLDAKTKKAVENRLAGLEEACRKFCENHSDFIVVNENTTGSQEQWLENILTGQTKRIEKPVLEIDSQNKDQMRRILTTLQQEKVKRNRGETISNPLNLAEIFETEEIRQIKSRVAHSGAIVSIKEKKFFPVVRFVSYDSEKYFGKSSSTINGILKRFFVLKLEDQDLRCATEQEILDGSYLPEYDQIVRDNPPKFNDTQSNYWVSQPIIGEKTYYPSVRDAWLIRVSKGLETVKDPSSLGKRIAYSRKKWEEEKITPSWWRPSEEEKEKKCYLEEYDDMNKYFYLISEKTWK